MKTAVAAATFILAASAFTIPGFGQKRNAVEQPATLVAKHQARNKPVNLPRNKAPARKAAAHPSRPKKASTMPKPKTKPATKSSTSPPETATEEEVNNEENEVNAEDDTIDNDADKHVSGTEHEHVPRANKPKPKPASKKPASKSAPAKKPAPKPASKPVSGDVGGQDDDNGDVNGHATANADPAGEVGGEEGSVKKVHPRGQAKNNAAKPKPKATAQHAKAQPKKAAAKPASKPAAKPAPKPAPEEVEDEEEGETRDVEGDADVNPETIEPTEEVEHEEGNASKVHRRGSAKVNASKPKPKAVAQHAKTQPKKAASQPQKGASTGKKASSVPQEEAQGAPFDQISTVEKTVGNKLHSRAGKPAPKKATGKKAATHKSPATAKTPVKQADDDTPINTVATVAKTVTSKLHSRNVPPTSDIQILQYALTLEHLENAFYHGALEKFNQQAFVKGGLPSFARKRFEQIAEHEAAHVAFLTEALGDEAPEPCEYDFPYTDPKSFAALSMVLEGVGVSAYLGVAEFIKNPEYLTAAGSILTTEARHAAWVAGAVEKDAPWSGAFDVPLSGDDVFSLAAPFIKSCPSSNPDLGVKAFPKLAIKTEDYKAGDTITLEFDDSEADGEPTFLALFNGLNVTYIKIEDNDQATLPSDLQGTVYGVITTNGTAVSDETTIAGVAILDFYENY